MAIATKYIDRKKIGPKKFGKKFKFEEKLKDIIQSVQTTNFSAKNYEQNTIIPS